jgi:hypothetical protein
LCIQRYYAQRDNTASSGWKRQGAGPAGCVPKSEDNAAQLSHEAAKLNKIATRPSRTGPSGSSWMGATARAPGVGSIGSSESEAAVEDARAGQRLEGFRDGADAETPEVGAGGNASADRWVLLSPIAYAICLPPGRDPLPGVVGGGLSGGVVRADATGHGTGGGWPASLRMFAGDPAFANRAGGGGVSPSQRGAGDRCPVCSEHPGGIGPAAGADGRRADPGDGPIPGWRAPSAPALRFSHDPGAVPADLLVGAYRGGPASSAPYGGSAFLRSPA